jgi:uncharacterized membrane protein YhaH (DUF805 family)
VYDPFGEKRTMDTSAIKKDYFSFDGRINRQPFWMRTLMLWVAIFVLAMIGALLMTIAGDSSVVAGIVGLVAIVAYIPLLIAALSLNIRRCHDRGRAGWFFILSVVPIVSIWYLIEIGFLPGTPGSNEYGDDPLGSAPLSAMPATAGPAT